MDLHAITFGLGITACVITGIVLLFALYVQMGTQAQKGKVARLPKEGQK